MSFSHSNRLRLDWLETFLAIAETGSLTAAGERVARSQSAISLQLRQLEDAIGARLFERGHRTVRLTTVGERLRPYAHRVVEAADAALGVGEVHEDRLVRVGVPEEYAEGVIPRALAGLARHSVGLAVEVHCAESSVIEARVRSGRLDLAFAIADEIEEPGDRIATDPTVWLQAPGFDISRRPLPVALFDQACSWRRRAIAGLEAAGIEYRVAFTSASVSGVRAGIRSGLAVGALGLSTVTGDLERVTGEGAPAELPPAELVLLRGNTSDPVIENVAAQASERLVLGLV
jgi:DNA-binding transcriptional LysR family regulator